MLFILFFDKHKQCYIFFNDEILTTWLLNKFNPHSIFVKDDIFSI